MPQRYYCGMRGRIAALRAAAGSSPAVLLNGIEYVEVEPGQKWLRIHFVHSLDDAPAVPLTRANVEIRGGVRSRDPRVTRVVQAGSVLRVEVAAPGDFSTYRLRIVASAADDRPPAGIDPALAQVDFSFKVDCPSDFDCRVTTECAAGEVAPPAIDYLARDYGAFRRTMLDRLSALLPQWQERSPADLWVTLVELVAYRADALSYFQDAVSTEAYLGTARTRVAVRRHARLLDYPFADGRSARTWLAFEVDAAAGVVLVPGCDPHSGVDGTAVATVGSGTDHSDEQVFETLHDVACREAHNEIHFYTWSDDDCCLPRGGTRATLLEQPGRPLALEPGDVLVLEQARDPATGRHDDADRRLRHPVRLTRVVRTADPLTGATCVEVAWAEADALPFPLPISQPGQPGLAVARGNIALADHGRTVAEDRLEPATPAPGPLRPLLEHTRRLPLTQQARVRLDGGRVGLVDPAAPAAAAMHGDTADVRPAVELHEGRRRWSLRRDLLGSGRFAADFTVETEDDGRAYVRFGDGTAGRRPAPSGRLAARYRVGTGSAGTVAPDTLTVLVGPVPGVTGVRNPLGSWGAQDPEPIEHARLYAPHAFRRQERAVTPEDYQRVAQRHPEVVRAVATRRWTGSWHTLFLAVDRAGGAPIDAPFVRALRTFLERYRLAGHDVTITPPVFVSLDVALDVCAAPGHYAPDVRQRLLRAFSAARDADGGTGFFHPDNFSFGAPVYLSAIVARAMQVPGVASVSPTRFQRWGRADAGERDAAVIRTGRLEVARLENDPTAPEHGRLEITVRGGT